MDCSCEKDSSGRTSERPAELVSILSNIVLRVEIGVVKGKMRIFTLISDKSTTLFLYRMEK